MNNKILFTSGLFATVITGVLYLTHSVAHAPLTEKDPSKVTVPVTKLAEGSQSTVKTRVNYLITSPDEFKKLWTMVSATGTPPEIDFNTQAVIGVFAGESPTTGYAISVTKVSDAQERKVSVVLKKPDARCIEAQMVTTPWEVVAVAATSIPFTHEDIVTTTPCSN